jgi:hypothetical protein
VYIAKLFVLFVVGQFIIAFENGMHGGRLAWGRAEFTYNHGSYGPDRLSPRPNDCALKKTLAGPKMK